MKIKKYQLVMFLLSFSLLFSFSSVVLAEGNNMPFSVLVLKTNSHMSESGYFNLKTKPNTEEKLDFLVTNTSNQQIILNVVPAYAISNNNGAISYIPYEPTMKETEYDSTASNLVVAKGIQIAKEIVLQPNEARQVSFRVQTPDSDSGVYLGGLHFTQNKELDASPNPSSEGSASFSMKNEFEFILGIQLNMPKQQEEKYQIGENVLVDMSGSQPLVRVPVDNLNNTILTSNFKLEVFKIDKEIRKSVFTGSIPFKMAPKSNADYSIPWDGTFEGGDYEVHITDKNREIESIPFTIKKRDVSKVVNNYDPKTIIKEEAFPLWVKVVLGALVIVSLVLLLLFLRVTKQNKIKGKEEGV